MGKCHARTAVKIMKLGVNDISFNIQFPDKYKAYSALKTFAEVLANLRSEIVSKVKDNDICVPETVCKEMYLAHDYTFLQGLKDLGSENKELFNVLLFLFTSAGNVKIESANTFMFLDQDSIFCGFFYNSYLISLLSNPLLAEAEIEGKLNNNTCVKKYFIYRSYL